MSYGDVEPHADRARTREVQYEFSRDLPELLRSIGISVIVSTYQAGKLVVLWGESRGLGVSFHSFDRPMGVAVDQRLDRLAVATRDRIWLALHQRGVARAMPETAGSCFLARSAHITGDIQAHEITWAENDELWIVNTRFSCLCTLDETHSFVPRWRPSFIDRLAAEDRCHLNGLAMVAGHPKYVTALGQTNSAEGWRAEKHKSGCLIDVESNEVVAQGFAMPHSPRSVSGHTLLLDSGRGSLVRVDPSGGVDMIGRFPGFTRGLALHAQYAIVGLSKIREMSTFGELPISENRDRLKCGVALVDLRTGQLHGQFEFKSGIDEIFDVCVVPHPGRTLFFGPNPMEDEQDTIWVVPGMEHSNKQ